METIYEIDTIKIEKEKAMRRYRNFRKIANIVRIVEVMIAITLISFVISRTSSCLPTVFEFSGVIFRRLSSIWLSPLFLFVICNVIVITLFANYSPSSTEYDDVSVKVAADIDEVVEIMSSEVAAFEIPATEVAAAEIPATEVAAVEIPASEVAAVEIPATEVAVVETTVKREVTEKVYRRRMSESTIEFAEKPELRRSATVSRPEIGSDEVLATKVTAVETAVEREVTEKFYRRSQSEAIVEVVEKPELRRSATVPRRKKGIVEVSATETETEADAKVNAKARSDEEELSNEEFNRRVEEFIEKQRKFLSEESKILVLSMSN